MYDKQQKDYPVSSWKSLRKDENIQFKQQKLVKHKMSSDIFSVDKNDSIELVLNIMKWKNINHMPVINSDMELIGLITMKDVNAYFKNDEPLRETVKYFMTEKLITTHEFETIESVSTKMMKHNINSLPVLRNNKLIGIITTNDL